MNISAEQKFENYDALNFEYKEDIAKSMSSVIRLEAPNSVRRISHRDDPLREVALFWSQVVVGTRFGLLIPAEEHLEQVIHLLDDSPWIRDELSRRGYPLLHDLHITPLIQKFSILQKDFDACEIAWDAFLLYSDVRRSTPLSKFWHTLSQEGLLASMITRVNNLEGAFLSRISDKKANSSCNPLLEGPGAMAFIDAFGVDLANGFSLFLELCEEINLSILKHRGGEMENPEWSALRGHLVELFEPWIAILREDTPRQVILNTLKELLRLGIIQPEEHTNSRDIIKQISELSMSALA